MLTPTLTLKRMARARLSCAWVRVGGCFKITFTANRKMLFQGFLLDFHHFITHYLSDKKVKQ
jgi:hypothetical protein